MAFVVSDGSLRSLSPGIGSPALSLRLADDYTPDYAAIWRKQGSVRTVVDFLGRNVASLGLHVYRRKSNTDRERVTDHPLVSLLGAPNPGTTAYRLKDAVVRDLGIFDRAYLLKVKTASGGLRLVRLPPAKVRDHGELLTGPEEFELLGVRGSKRFKADEVVYFPGYSPDGGVAVSPIESLRSVLAEEFEASRMREQVLRNGARVSGYLERPAGGPAWSDSARRRFAAAWRAQYAGGGPEAGGTPILEDGMKFVPASQSSKDLQYVEVRKLTREEVAAAYFIPPTMVGVMDSATFSNVREQHKHLYQDTLGPILSRVAGELQAQLLPDFEDADGLYVEFNLEEKLRGSFEEQAQQLQASVGGPWLTRNEARARANLPRIEGGDELIVPLNVTEGGQASPQDSAPKAGPAPEPKDAPVLPAGWTGLHKSPELDDGQRARVVSLFAEHFGRQKAAVLAALGAGGAWWDAERWNAELKADLFGLALDLSEQLGRGQAAALGFSAEDYDVERTLAFLEAVAASRAEWVNDATKEQLEAALEAGDKPAAVFERAEAQRALSAGALFATTMAGFALVEAARQLKPDRAVKVWRVNSAHPRSSHAHMAGKTAPVGERFENGLMWPGDPVKGPGEVAGCLCSVDVIVKD